MFLSRLETIALSLLTLLLPTQLGLHFWLPFSYVSGIRVDYLSPTLYLTDLLILFVIGINSRHLIHRLRSPRILLLAFISTAVLLGSISPINSFFRLARILLYSLLLLSLRGSLAKLKPLFYHLLPLSLVLVSTIAILQFLQQSSLGGPLRLLGERTFSASTPGIALASLPGTGLFLRPYSTFSHPNSLAAFLLLGLLMISPSRSKLSFLTIPISLIALALAFSKTVLLTLGILFICRFFPRATPFLFMLFLTISLFSFIPLGHVSSSISERQLLVNNAFAIIARRPLMGVGLNNFIPASYALFLENSVNFAPYQLQPVHHIPLLLIAEVGLLPLGILIYLFFPHITAIIRSLLTHPQTSQGRILIVLFVTSLFDHYWYTLPQNTLLMVFFLAFLIGPQNPSFALPIPGDEWRGTPIKSAGIPSTWWGRTARQDPPT